MIIESDIQSSTYSNCLTQDSKNNICYDPRKIDLIKSDFCDLEYVSSIDEEKNIFWTQSEIKEAFKDKQRSSEITDFLDRFERVFYSSEPKLLGSVNKIEISESPDSINILWKYKKSTIYFSFTNDSVNILYGALIFVENRDERIIVSGQEVYDQTRRTQRIENIIREQISRIIG